MTSESESKNKCDCLQKLDKLRLDHEQGTVSFVCFVFRGQGVDLEIEPILHEVSSAHLQVAAGEATFAAFMRRWEDTQEAMEGK